MPKIVSIYANAMGSGKSTAADVLLHNGFKLVSFANPLKLMLRSLLISLGYPFDEVYARLWGSKKEAPIPELGGLTARKLAQTLGTEWGRSLDPNFWVKIAVAQINQELDKGHSVVIDDCRFENEAVALRELNTIFIRIDRPGTEITQQHASEGGLVNWSPDWVVSNNSTIDDLQSTVLDIVLGAGAGRLCMGDEDGQW